MTEHYVQCCGANYGAQGLALYRSMERHCGDFHLTWICVGDELVRRLFEIGLKRCTVVHIAQLEACIPALMECRKDRTEREWYWTLASQATWWALESIGKTVTYIDTDLFFFRDPGSLHYVGPADAAMFDHRFPDVNGERNPLYKRALYNVGWNEFRYSDGGRRCAKWWAEKTREKCSETMPSYPEWGIPPGRAGDQAYLEGFNKICNVCVIQNALGNWAPYNVPESFGEMPMFYHFHEWRCPESRTGYPLSDEVINRIYVPYEKAVKEASEELWSHSMT